MEFEKTWESNQLHLKNFIATKVPEQDVLDILQNVSIEFYKNIKYDKEILNPKNWLFQVTRNKIADYYKSKYRSIESEANFLAMASEEIQPCVCDITELIIKSLLPTEYGTPLILSDIYRVPQKEIAKQLDLSYVNTKSRIQRARKKFEEEIGKSVELSYNS